MVEQTNSARKGLVALVAAALLGVVAGGCGDDSTVGSKASADTAQTAGDANLANGDGAVSGDGAGGVDAAGACSPSQCDDANPCTDDTCDADKGCQHADNAGACSDGNACTSGDTCTAGKCAPGTTAAVCTDNNPCTADSCDPKSGNCVFLPAAATCDDGDACSSGDTCAAGVCVGTPSCSCTTAADCTDKNPCTSNTCDAGKCVAVAMPSGATCSDGDACTTGDLCAGTTCQPGKPLSCDDNNPCTDDACLPSAGCISTANTAPCDDGKACTTGDICSSGSCQANTSACACKIAPDCDDKNACTVDSCDNGACSSTPVADGEACSDGNACTAGDHCQGAVCLAASASSCDDSNPCTDDACDPKLGCLHTANATPCDDGNACTKADSCAGGSCSGGVVNGCSDNNPCTADTCDPSAGCAHTPSTAACSDGNPCTDDLCDPSLGCSHPANTAACSDGDACTSGDACSAGACLPGAATTCDDSQPCTTDSCDKASGCSHAAVADGTVCKDKNCLADGSFDPGATCLAGACTATGAPEPCDDKNVCTADACVPSSGCSHIASDVPCDDGTVCTDGDLCAKGTCVPGKLLACDDGNLCTSDQCDPKLGCMFIGNALPCDDGNACTTPDVCALAKCTAGPTASCDDGNVCTADSCDTKKGCLHIATLGACSDGSVCTSGDTCQLGVCTAGSTVVCNDNNLCTSDSCDAIDGCKFIANTAPCDDGSLCTVNDACKDAKCQPGAAADCNDKNACTDDSCDATKGCANKANTAACDDGITCTGSPDKCVGGTCVGATANKCDDGNPCTTDLCDAGGSCSHPALANGSVCAAAACGSSGFTGPALCTAGVCGAVPAATSCDDKNPCTSDLCNPLSGCQHAVNTAACDDGDACTMGDVCSLGTCTAGSAANCNDNNLCTTDSCDKAKGCVNAANTLPCDDGDACTTADTCAASKCTGGPAPNCNDNNPCTADSCDKKVGCQNPNVADGTACGTAACTGLSFQPSPVCKAATCTVVPVQNCDDALECTVDACDISKGCLNPAKPYGTVCTTAAPSQLYPFCAGPICTGVEPATAQVSGSAATRGILLGIDRMPGDKLYPVGADNSLTVNNQKVLRGIVASVVESPLALQFNSQAGAASALFDVRTRLAVGSQTTGNGPQPLTMTWNAGNGTWQQSGPSLNVSGVGTVQQPLRAVDMVLPLTGPEWFVYGGDANLSVDGPPTFGFSTFANNNWSAITPIQVSSSKNSCSGGQNFRPLSILGVYAADTKSVFAVGSMAANGNLAAASMVAYWDGALKQSCGGDVGSIFTAVANSNDYPQSLVVQLGQGLGVGVFKAVHGSSASHVLVGGGQGTLYSFDAGKWTQQIPQYTGMPATWGSGFDVHGVYVTATEGWVTGTIDSPVGPTTCRTGFVLHGSFAGGKWSWDEMISLSKELRTCGANLDWSNLTHVMVDSSSGAVYVVGSQGTDAKGVPVTTAATQQSQVILRVKTK